ncbi:MAG: hypothetical protein SGILL_007933 [Bacillariaceae sp.]
MKRSLMLSLVLAGLVCLSTVRGSFAEKQEDVPANHLRALHGTNTFDIPFTASPFEASLHHESGPRDSYGNCVRPGFDAQRTQDQICQQTDLCHLGWTESEDFLMYEFAVTEDHFAWDWYNWEEAIFVDVTVRVASANPNRRIQLQIGNDLDIQDDDWPSIVLDTPGRSFQSFEDVTWHNVRLPADISLHHRLYIHFLQGSVNMCSVTVKPSRIAPFRAPATDFDFYLDRDRVDYYDTQSCGTEKQGTVDAQATSDILCQKRDGSSCNIGWTVMGEYMYADFDTVEPEDYVVWARVASERADKVVRVELQVRDDPDGHFNDQQSSFEFNAPGLGWQEFVDVQFAIYLGEGHYRLRVVFDDGSVNLCSAGVDKMVHWSTGEYEIPITFNALEYDYVIDSNPEEVRGDCPEPVAYPETDASESHDATCLKSGPCFISFAEPGEVLRYDFSTVTRFDLPRHSLTGPVVTVVLRVASNNPSKRFTVELDGSRKTFTTPGKGWDVFEDIVWENIQLRNFFYHPLYVIFDDGNVNLCSVTVR